MALETLTKENFNEKIQSSDIAVIDFWAPWCGPCRQFAPIFEETAQEYPEILFGKVNTEDEQELASYFQIRSIPTVMVIKEGVVSSLNWSSSKRGLFKDILSRLKEGLDNGIQRFRSLENLGKNRPKFQG